MSTINVDVINPQSGTEVNVNGVYVKENAAGGLALGFGSLANNTTGNSNIGAGNNSLNANTLGINNVAVGISSMLLNTTGNRNVAIGNGSCRNVNSNYNVGIGANSAEELTTGSKNVAIGESAGNLLVTGENNIIIGYLSQAATTSSNNSITLGNSYHTVLRCNVTTITSLSDERDKKDIEALPVGLSFIEKLNPVKFVWNDRDDEVKRDIVDFGFIAQELKATQESEDASFLNLVYDENPEKLEASYGKLLPVLVKAIQEMSTEIKSLKAELETLKNK